MRIISLTIANFKTIIKTKSDLMLIHPKEEFIGLILARYLCSTLIIVSYSFGDLKAKFSYLKILLTMLFFLPMINFISIVESETI